MALTDRKNEMGLIVINAINTIFPYLFCFDLILGCTMTFP